MSAEVKQLKLRMYYIYDKEGYLWHHIQQIFQDVQLVLTGAERKKQTTSRHGLSVMKVPRVIARL